MGFSPYSGKLQCCAHELGAHRAQLHLRCGIVRLAADPGRLVLHSLGCVSCCASCTANRLRADKTHITVRHLDMRWLTESWSAKHMENVPDFGYRIMLTHQILPGWPPPTPCQRSGWLHLQPCGPAALLHQLPAADDISPLISKPQANTI
jgi:hypothetical protein